MRLVMLLILGTYIIVFLNIVRQRNEILVSKISKILVLLLYFLILLVIVYFTLLVFLFGYNS